MFNAQVVVGLPLGRVGHHEVKLLVCIFGLRENFRLEPSEAWAS